MNKEEQQKRWRKRFDAAFQYVVAVGPLGWWGNRFSVVYPLAGKSTNLGEFNSIERAVIVVEQLKKHDEGKAVNVQDGGFRQKRKAGASSLQKGEGIRSEM